MNAELLLPAFLLSTSVQDMEFQAFKQQEFANAAHAALQRAEVLQGPCNRDALEPMVMLEMPDFEIFHEWQRFNASLPDQDQVMCCLTPEETWRGTKQESMWASVDKLLREGVPAANFVVVWTAAACEAPRCCQ